MANPNSENFPCGGGSERNSWSLIPDGRAPIDAFNSDELPPPEVMYGALTSPNNRQTAPLDRLAMTSGAQDPDSEWRNPPIKKEIRQMGEITLQDCVNGDRDCPPLWCKLDDYGKVPESIRQGYEEIRHGLAQLANFIFQNTPQEKRYGEIQAWLNEFLVNYDSEYRKFRTFRMRGFSWSPVERFDLNLSDLNLKGDLIIPECLKIHELNCSGNQITRLKLNSTILDLNCAGNQITSLELNPVLTRLNCAGNNIRSLDLGRCPEVRYVDCSDNPIEEIDLTGNPSLEDFRCNKTNVRKFDFSRNRYIRHIRINNCPIEKLVLRPSGLSGVRHFSCTGDNKLSPEDKEYLRKMQPSDATVVLDLEPRSISPLIRLLIAFDATFRFRPPKPEKGRAVTFRYFSKSKQIDK